VSIDAFLQNEFMNVL